MTRNRSGLFTILLRLNRAKSFPRVIRENYAGRKWRRNEQIKNRHEFGPQRRRTVLRLVLELDGEVVIRADPHVGLLPAPPREAGRGRARTQSVPLHGSSRLYVDDVQRTYPTSWPSKLADVDVPVRAQYIA